MTKTKNKTSGKITEAYKSLRYVTLRYVTYHDFSKEMVFKGAKRQY